MSTTPPVTAVATATPPALMQSGSPEPASPVKTPPLVAVLDTNVIVSAFLSPGGPPARILASLGRRAFVPAVDASILSEYHAVLLHPKFGLTRRDVDSFLREFRLRGWAVEATAWSGSLVDESDRVFLEVAVGARALLVTGNLRHLPAEPWVISPSIFWERLAVDI